MNYWSFPFCSEEMLQGDYAVATYIATGLSQDYLKRVGGFAVGQSVGTWAALPGITDFMVEHYQARVTACHRIPDTDSSLLRLAFPMKNFCGSLSMLLTAMVGNDVSTSLDIRLVDLSFTGQSLAAFRGPRRGIAGWRELTGVADRPLILNMIKPCLGFTPEEGAALFYAAGSGGVDLIKDDELFANLDICPIIPRMRAYNLAAKRLMDDFGRAPAYIVNISDRPSKMREHARAAIDEGVRAVMVNCVTTSNDALLDLTEEFGDRLCFLAHYAGVGIISGVHESLMIGTLPRLAGADAMMTMFPGVGKGEAYQRFLAISQKQNLPMGGIAPTMTVIGGGVTPLNLAHVVSDLGKDIILGVGGAIQGHPMGAKAGGEAVMCAVRAAADGVSLEEAAAGCAPLQAAIEAWG